MQINDTAFHIKSFGKGKPVVLFEAGLASDMNTWENIPKKVANNTSIFLYDRAGIGKSGLSSRARTIPNMVLELRSILEKTKIEPPYVYVAHSMGSNIVRYYAKQYPQEIVGLLLVDPSPDRLYDDYTEKEYIEFVERGNKAFENSNPGARREWTHYLENRKYMRGLQISDEIPMIIISATEWDFRQYHRKMINHHEKSRNITIEGSHGIHQEQPGQIIDLILDLVNISE